MVLLAPHAAVMVISPESPCSKDAGHLPRCAVGTRASPWFLCVSDAYNRPALILVRCGGPKVASPAEQEPLAMAAVDWCRSCLRETWVLCHWLWKRKWGAHWLGGKRPRCLVSRGDRMGARQARAVPQLVGRGLDPVSPGRGPAPAGGSEQAPASALLLMALREETGGH